jgi:hypothetical protein
MKPDSALGDGSQHTHITYTVNEVKQTTSHKEMTPNQILKAAGINPETHYLLEIEGHNRKSFRDHGEEKIEMRDHLHFSTVALHQPIEYTVDGEKQFTKHHERTPNEILTDAKIDAGNHYLVELEAHNQRRSFENQGDLRIHLHEHERFISISTKPTPVS